MGKSKSGLVASKKAIDPSLDALFSASAGPVTAPAKARYADPLPARTKPEPKSKPVKTKAVKVEVAAIEEDEDEDEDLDEDLEELSELDSDAESISDLIQSVIQADSDEEEEVEEKAAKPPKVSVDPATTTEVDDGRKRKRRQRDEYDNLESKYLDRLANDDEPTVKRLKAEEKKDDDEEVQDAEAGEGDDEDSVVEDAPPVHESLAADSAAVELEKANRTVFLSNVSFEAVTSSTAKKTLMRHLKSSLDKKADPPQKVESIRFRSTAFSTAAMPKRAAYIKKNVMEATTKSTNAYVVYSTNAAARQAVAELNGSIVLERHIRVDSVAHPAPVDHKRCVFVGNLGFVDDESVLNTKVDENGKEITEKKKRGKVPMDVEEGLWRVFSKEGGKVESVRVVRDPITRVGKGIAYVQFYDANAVEAAVLLNGKKFPPMLPRELRVSRCKAPHKTARAMEAKQKKLAGERGPKHDKKSKKGSSYVPKVTPDAKTLAGRAGKLLGRAAARAHLAGSSDKKDRRDAPRRRESGAGAGDGDKVMRSPEDIVFEGRRASAKDGKPKDLKFKGTRPKGDAKRRSIKAKKTGHGAVRAAKWRGAGGDKK
ncbi:nucleolar protein 12 [Podospora conica]|nr:nucleolar protein 12 [Schizothecium conicum]